MHSMILDKLFVLPHCHAFKHIYNIYIINIYIYIIAAYTAGQHMCVSPVVHITERCDWRTEETLQ